MFKQILIISIVCMIGAFINSLIPEDWNYAFGFAVGTFLQTILSID